VDDNTTTTTWWLWDATIEDRGTRVVLEVKTTLTNGFRVDTPVGYFPESDAGSAVDGWIADRIMIDNDEFARLRAAGVIQPLSQSWAVEP
jgi:hypothetical protein